MIGQQAHTLGRGRQRSLDAAHVGEGLEGFEPRSPHGRDREARQRYDHTIEFERPESAWLHSCGRARVESAEATESLRPESNRLR